MNNTGLIIFTTCILNIKFSKFKIWIPTKKIIMPLPMILSVFSQENIVRLRSQQVDLQSVCFLSTSGIDQCATRSLFKTLMGHSEPLYSCYINDSKHKGKVGYIPIFSDLNYFIPNFQIKLVCNPHSAGTQLKFVIHWLLKYVNVFLSTC